MITDNFIEEKTEMFPSAQLSKELCYLSVNINQKTMTKISFHSGQFDGSMCIFADLLVETVLAVNSNWFFSPINPYENTLDVLKKRFIFFFTI